MPETDHPLLRDYSLVAGGLALILSRCTAAAIQKNFAASLRLYEALRHQMKRGRATAIDAGLFSEVSHEIAEIGDRATRQAVLRCLRSHAAARHLLH